MKIITLSKADRKLLEMEKLILKQLAIINEEKSTCIDIAGEKFMYILNKDDTELYCKYDEYGRILYYCNNGVEFLYKYSEDGKKTQYLIES